MLKKAFWTMLSVFGVMKRAPDAVAVERSLHDPGGRKRVVIYRLSDGQFSYQEEVYNDKVLDMRWEPQGLSDGYPSADEAAAAARKALPWLWAVQD